MAKAEGSSVEHPGVLGATALARIDDQRARLERHARETSGNDADAIAAGEHEWAQIDVARRHALLDAGRARGERQRRLRDEVLGIPLELLAECRNRRLVGLGTDQHAVTARAVD